VLETKDESVFLQALLPFVMNSERFTHFSIKNSKGSTNPYILFSDLAQYEFELPTMAEQKQLAEVLWQMTEVKNAYLALVEQTEQLVKSQFIELFGDLTTNPKGWRVEPWSEVLTIKNGKAHKNVSRADGAFPIYGSGGDMGRATQYLCDENVIIVGRKGTIDKPLLVREKIWIVDTAFGIEANSEVLHYEYLYQFCLFFDFQLLNKTVTLPSLTKNDLLKIKIQIPPLALQNRFAEFVRQADKSKFHLHTEWLTTYKILHILCKAICNKSE
jgi:type I restriction enzyme S subunit